jgi:putative flavoprotein involved in K+ transport
MDTYDVIVIGGGQAGLATGYHLQREGLRFIILEAGAEPTGSWPRYYDSLKLFSPARYSSMPGMPFPGDPERYPARDEVVAYLRAYAKHFNLPIVTNARIETVEKQGTNFTVTTSDGTVRSTRSVIAASGAFNRPFIPTLEEQNTYTGQILHSSSYMNPQPFVGKRVLVVGAGNSAVQIATELARSTDVTLTSRDPVKFMRQRLLGQDVHFWLRVTGIDTFNKQFSGWSPLPKSGNGVLDTGVYQAALKSGKPAYKPLFSHFTPQGVMWSDGTESAFDTMIFATGFKPNFPYLQGLDVLGEYGNAHHRGGISTIMPGLYFVGISGQRSIASATIRGVGDDAAHIIRHLKQTLKGEAKVETRRCCGGLLPSFGR